jgi:hypothetical protein
VFFNVASPLFISTQVNEPLPTSAVESEVYQRFISMNEKEKMQAAKQMSAQGSDNVLCCSSE